MNRPFFPRTLSLSRFHLVGIGGIGMSAIAEILAASGYTVTGSDLHSSPLLEHLERLGVECHVGHDAGHVGSAQAVVYSSAIPASNPEIQEARQRRLPVVHRSEALAELMRFRTGIAVSGTHGKTTTTSMLAVALIAADQDPTVVIGARLENLGSNARLGKGELLVAEADESDRSFLRLPAVCSVITNIDFDHMDEYRDESDLMNAFQLFADQVPFFGCVVICADDTRASLVAKETRRPVLTYAIHQDAHIRADSLQEEPQGMAFDCVENGRSLGRVELRVPGEHNVQNALAVVAVTRWLNLPFEKVCRGLAQFTGAERRLQFKGERGGVRVVDDYAHHPTEIRATLRACRQSQRRLVVVFQPHRYSRTQNLLGQMADCFEGADRLFLMDVYAAGEKPIAGVTGRTVAEEIKHPPAHYVEDREQLMDVLRSEAREGDTLLTMGAGDVWQIGEKFLE